MNIPDGYNVEPEFITDEAILSDINTVGNVFYVSSVDGATTNDGLTRETPLTSINLAKALCVADNNDIIYLLQGHVETLSTAAQIDLSVNGISVIGLGSGNNRPKITIGTSNLATLAITGTSIKLKNIIVIGALDGLDNAVIVTGDDCDIDIEYRDTSSTVEANVALQLTGVDRGKIKLRYIGFIAGNACTNAIILTGCTHCDIFVEFYGVASTGVVEFLTTASHDIKIDGFFYNEGTTDLSKNVVMTVAACTYSAQGFDGSAGCAFSGSDNSAIAKDDLSAVSTNVSTIITKIGTLVNAGGSADLGSMLGDFANTALVTRLNNILAAVSKTGAFAWGVIDAAASSTTVLPVLALAGYGTDFFKTRFYVQVLKNANNAGVAPEGEIRQVTAYNTTTGAFTCSAFSFAVEANDIILVLHESARYAYETAKLFSLDDRSAALVYPDSVFAESILAFIMSKSASPVVTSFDNTTDSLEAISDAIAYIKNNKVIATGTFTTSSATVPADTTLGAAKTTNNYYNGCILMPLTGTCAFQPRQIKTYTGTTGVFTLETETPFTAATGAVTYVILTATSISGFNTLVPVTPTVGSLYDILSKAAGANTFDKATDSLEAISEAIAVIDLETDKIAATIVKIDAEIVKTAAIKAKTDVLPSKITKTQTFVNTAAATIDLFTITGTVDIELCAVVKTNVESAAGCNIKVDCGALAIIADSDCTTLEAGEIWFANTPTTSVVALNPPAASFALSPIKKFRVTNGQDITMTIEAAKQVDSGVIDYYVKWEAVSSDGTVVTA